MFVAAFVIIGIAAGGILGFGAAIALFWLAMHVVPDNDGNTFMLFVGLLILLVSAGLLLGAFFGALIGFRVTAPKETVQGQGGADASRPS